MVVVFFRSQYLNLPVTAHQSDIVLFENNRAFILCSQLRQHYTDEYILGAMHMALIVTQRRIQRSFLFI